MRNFSYYIKINSENNLDESRINNCQTVTFFVSNTPNPPAFRLGEYQFDSVSHSQNIDGFSVVLISANSTSVSFSVAGEVTGGLNDGDYWFNQNNNFLLYVDNITYLLPISV